MVAGMEGDGNGKELKWFRSRKMVIVACSGTDDSAQSRAAKSRGVAQRQRKSVVETRISNIEATLQALTQTTQTIAKGQERQEAMMRNLERHMGQLARQAEWPTNVFPSDIISNPREECKAVQLRNGKIMGNDKGTNKKQAEEDKNDQESSKKEEGSQASKKGKKLEINIPLAEALEQMPLYEKFLKKLITKKKSWLEKETVVLNQESSAIIQKGHPPKLKDPGSFLIPGTIGNMAIDKALYDLGVSINLMLLSMMKKLMIEEVKPTRMSLQLADRSLKIPNRVVENLLVKDRKFIFSADL
ncbi:uncharacterized protein LOC107620732 [Arachis ipaensis]|uniref:uncharacterized protein LOC107620732 n=1 Tax=Arachis ipaensis TaxID=130454 RepID=UPI0007AF1878|nr:uncharacterized protein LOC107620732 [Arachis ipaensis]